MTLFRRTAAAFATLAALLVGGQPAEPVRIGFIGGLSLQRSIVLDATGDNVTPVFMTEVRAGRFASIR